MIRVTPHEKTYYFIYSHNNYNNVDDYKHLQQSEKGETKKMATKKENSLFEEIERIHVKAKEIRTELRGMGLDSMIEEQERIVIASLISNVFWDCLNDEEKNE